LDELAGLDRRARLFRVGPRAWLCKVVDMRGGFAGHANMRSCRSRAAHTRDFGERSTPATSWPCGWRRSSFLTSTWQTHSPSACSCAGSETKGLSGRPCDGWLASASSILKSLSASYGRRRQRSRTFLPLRLANSSRLSVIGLGCKAWHAYYRTNESGATTCSCPLLAGRPCGALEFARQQSGAGGAETPRPLAQEVLAPMQAQRNTGGVV
jgi:hypothetical protein